MRPTEQELRKHISTIYGFKENLITNPVQCGLWHVRFTVNKIKYYGCISHSGAEPCLFVEGYEYQYYDHTTPVTEEYYNNYIKDKKIRLLLVHDPSNKEWEEGDWKDTGIRFNSLEEYEQYIATKKDNCKYDYDYEL